MTASDKVKAWIAENFEMDAVKVEPFELVPGGHTVTDSKGEQILVWYDFMRDRIEYKEGPTMNTLTEQQQAIFEAVHKKHLASMGEAERAKYELDRVEWDEDDQVFKVYYTNGDWWNYTLDGKWY